ncbi:YraN family protein [soil metagenome]
MGTKDVSPQQGSQHSGAHRQGCGGGAVRAAVGAFGEDVAARHLQDQGFVLLDRNWRCSAGEIDLVARSGGVLVFCEVKTRRGSGFGSPAEAVDRRKAARLRRLAMRWLSEHEVHPAQVRIDVIGVVMPPRASGRGGIEVEHLTGVC